VARPRLARWLKLHTIRWALERRAPEMRTFNDAVNEAILGLNQSLGFRRPRSRSATERTCDEAARMRTM